MNCKQNDLARVVCYANVPNRDRIVTCLRLASTAELRAHYIDEVGPVWVVDRDLVWDCSFGPVKLIPYAPDSNLRPIRDNDGEDEMLRIAGKPSDIKTLEVA